MGHSAELIQNILNAVQQDYPASQYTFITEKAIPGTRMHPDIYVLDAEGRAMCAVEIGYTRPEKLTAYRDELKIPDVRWYDKAGNLHADVKESVVRVSVETRPSGVFSVYVVHDLVLCESNECNDPDTDWETLGRKEFDEMIEYLAVATIVVIVTDFSRVWFCCYCDKCDERWMPSEDDAVDIFGLAEDLRSQSTREIAREWGARVIHGEWDEAVAYVKQYLDMELRYEDGEFLTPDARQGFQQAINTIRRESMATV